MRRIVKGEAPLVLQQEGEAWLQECLLDPDSDTKRLKYRHPDIKAALREETAWKCVYCESKIGGSSPGDIEHKRPVSVCTEERFIWENLTVACTECNRRKSNYHSDELPFIDPYVDPVEQDVLHFGPLVTWRPGAARAELSVRKLELNSLSRLALVQQKLDVLEKARALLDLTEGSADALTELRLDELRRMQSRNAEFSACVRTFVAATRPSAVAA